MNTAKLKPDNMNKRKQAASDAETTKITQNFECLWKD